MRHKTTKLDEQSILKSPLVEPLQEGYKRNQNSKMRRSTIDQKSLLQPPL